jgi:hypothetical protein
MMQALQIEGYADQPLAKLVEMPERSPAPGEVRVRVTAAALNPLDAKLAHPHRLIRGTLKLSLHVYRIKDLFKDRFQAIDQGLLANPAPSVP